MPKYTVHFVEEHAFSVLVEAKNSDEAQRKVEDGGYNSTPRLSHLADVQGVTVTEVEPLVATQIKTFLKAKKTK